MDIKLRVLPPLMPNFVKMRLHDRADLGVFPIKDFTKEEAEEYAELMKQEFIKHWQLKQVKQYFEDKNHL